MKKRLVVIAPVLLLVVLAVVLTNLFPFRQMFAADRAVASAQDELASITDANDQLVADLEALKTPAEVERVARDELGYTFPGEQAFVVVSPDDPAPDPASVDAVAEEDLPEPRPWYAPIVDFLTGRDLEPGS